jgi:hypothetical protein
LGVLMLAPWSVDVSALAALPDPTRPAAFVETTVTPTRATELILEFTLVSPQRRIVMINGHIYELGARVDGAVVTDIKPYEVTLTRQGRETRLRFFPRIAGAKQK